LPDKFSWRVWFIGSVLKERLKVKSMKSVSSPTVKEGFILKGVKTSSATKARAHTWAADTGFQYSIFLLHNHFIYWFILTQPLINR
jgi:hypothetical protein